MWYGDFAHQGQSVVFVLDGCRDVHGGDSLAIFPETLRSEFHGIRPTIEAYSRCGKLGTVDEPACGIRVGAEGAPGEFVVKSGNVVSRYRIDRWD